MRGEKGTKGQGGNWKKNQLRRDRIGFHARAVSWPPLLKETGGKSRRPGRIGSTALGLGAMSGGTRTPGSLRVHLMNFFIKRVHISGIGSGGVLVDAIVGLATGERPRFCKPSLCVLNGI